MAAQARNMVEQSEQANNQQFNANNLMSQNKTFDLNEAADNTIPLEQSGENNEAYELDKPGVEKRSPEERKNKLREAANKLEGLMVGMLMKQMRKTIPDSKLLNGGYGGKMFRSHLDRKYSQLVAENSNFGLADKIYGKFTGN